MVRLLHTLPLFKTKGQSSTTSLYSGTFCHAAASGFNIEPYGSLSCLVALLAKSQHVQTLTNQL